MRIADSPLALPPCPFSASIVSHTPGDVALPGEGDAAAEGGGDDFGEDEGCVADTGGPCGGDDGDDGDGDDGQDEDALFGRMLLNRRSFASWNRSRYRPPPPGAADPD